MPAYRTACIRLRGPACLAGLEGYRHWGQDVLTELAAIGAGVNRLERRTEVIEETTKQIQRQMEQIVRLLAEAQIKQSVIGTEADRDQVARRANRLGSILDGAKVLWVDDLPKNNDYERLILEQLGVSVDSVTTSDEALAALFGSPAIYDVIISDMDRGGDHTAGLEFLGNVVSRQLHVPVIFYVGALNQNRGAPARSFGITNRPDELMHLVMDALERSRG